MGYDARYTADGVCRCTSGYNCTGLCQSYHVTEFERQKAKLAEEVVGLGADLYALQEVENDAENRAQQEIASMLGDTFRTVFEEPVLTGGKDADGKIVGDVIKSGMIYNTAALELLGNPAQLNDTWIQEHLGKARDMVGCRGFEAELFASQRPVLAATFRVKATDAVFTAVAVHLKSKRGDSAMQKECTCTADGCLLNGSPCNDCDAGDGQGSFAGIRAKTIDAIHDWLKVDPTGVKSGNVLILGDWNSYAKEASVMRASELGYKAVFDDPNSFSFEHDGFWGSLDHAYASPAMFEAINGRHEKWHVNSLEASILRYPMDRKDSGSNAWYDMQWWASRYGTSTKEGFAFPMWTDLYAKNPFAASDHDPLLMCASLRPEAAPAPSAVREDSMQL